MERKKFGAGLIALTWATKPGPQPGFNENFATLSIAVVYETGRKVRRSRTAARRPTQDGVGRRRGSFGRRPTRD